MLPLRKSSTSGDRGGTLPTALHIEERRGAAGLPTLQGDLSEAPRSSLVVRLQIHNSAGIPIIEGRATVAPGDKAIVFAELRPIGIDAYAHKPADERTQIAERIWTRRAYGTLQLHG